MTSLDVPFLYECSPDESNILYEFKPTDNIYYCSDCNSYYTDIKFLIFTPTMSNQKFIEKKCTLCDYYGNLKEKPKKNRFSISCCNIM